MRIRACAFTLITLLAPAISYAPSVGAQGSTASDPFTDMARQRFQEGVRLFDQGKYEEARAAFLQAYALKKHPAVLLNLAQSELRAGHSVSAARHFSEYLRDNPNADPAERKAAEEGLTAARTKTARVDVSVDLDGADIFVDGELVGRSPLPEPVDVEPGTRTVEVRMPGRSPKAIDISTTLGQVQSVNIAFDETVTTTPPTKDPEQDSYALTTEGRKPFIPWLMEDQAAWATGGATVAGLGLGVLFIILANNASNNADTIAGQIKVRADVDKGLLNYEGFNRRSNPCASPIPITEDTNYGPACTQLQDNLDARDTNKTIATVGFVVAGVGAASTGVLYYLRSKPESDSTEHALERTAPSTILTPMITPGMQGLSIGGTF